jgi:prepilin-type N-terminal cleavage/methylation domain-containing protein
VRNRGFTLVELLIALVIGLAVSGAALLLASAARSAIAVEPVAVDAVRRVHAGVDAIAAAVAGAGGERGIGDDAGTVWNGLPALRLLTDGGSAFTGLVSTRVVNGGRGRLLEDQPGPGGALTLATAVGLCPSAQEVCGFHDGDAAAVFDGRGHFDVFIVGAVEASLSRITPRVPLAHAYRTGAWVIEVRQERLTLVRQGDGSQTLVRITAAGAREPIVDGVPTLTLEPWGRVTVPGLYATSESRFAQYGLLPPAPLEADAEDIFGPGSHCMAARDADILHSSLQPLAEVDGGLSPLTVAELDDGPWCPHDDAPERFDADWFRVRRIDVHLRVEALPAEFRGSAGRWFIRGGTAAHDAPRWVRDRTLTFSVAVGR